MKKLLAVMILATIWLSAGLHPGCGGYLMAQETPQPIAGGLLAVGEDNFLLFDSGQSSGYIAIGAGVDILNYNKSLSETSALDITIHPFGAYQVTNKSETPNATIFGVAAYVDLAKLISGVKGVTFMNNFAAKFGPVGAYNVTTGRPVYGLALNFSYTFD
ncbi:MAG: hypothetical protein PHY29_03015 [Syntrophales bacterium]|nr:hypothetical protein [Syntrophales bacterium]